MLDKILHPKNLVFVAMGVLIYMIGTLIVFDLQYPEPEITRPSGVCPGAVVGDTYLLATNNTHFVSLRSQPSHPDDLPYSETAEVSFGSTVRVSASGGETCLNPSLINFLGDWWVHVTSSDGSGWVRVDFLATHIE